MILLILSLLDVMRRNYCCFVGDLCRFLLRMSTQILVSHSVLIDNESNASSITRKEDRIERQTHENFKIDRKIERHVSK